MQSISTLPFVDLPYCYSVFSPSLWRPLSGYCIPVPSVTVITNANILLSLAVGPYTQWRIQRWGGGNDATAPFGLTVNSLFTLFCKLRFAIEPYNPCPIVSSDCPSFLPVKNCVKMHPAIMLETKIIFFCEGPSPSSTPHPAPPPYLNPKYVTAYTCIRLIVR